MIKSASVLALWVWASISWADAFSIAVSIIAGVYFASVLKVNVVDKKYGGSWVKYFRSWFN